MKEPPADDSQTELLFTIVLGRACDSTSNQEGVDAHQTEQWKCPHQLEDSIKASVPDSALVAKLFS
jgi:hypothetical protein